MRAGRYSIWSFIFIAVCVLPSLASANLADSPEDTVLESVQSRAVYAYRNYSQIGDALLATESQHSDIAVVIDIGDSWQTQQGKAARDILAIKISDNAQLDEDEPEVLIMALHHAREWITSEIALEAVHNLTDGYGNDPRISWLIDNREIWIIPVVNPDGLDYSLYTDQWWRKNRRLNYDGSYGVDLNRNYAGAMNNDSAGYWGGVGSSHVTTDETYCGESPFSEPETQAVRDLVLQRDFTICLDLHSFGDLVMWPWGYATNRTADDADFVRIGNELAALNGYTAEQSVGLYPTTGDSLDWLYGAENIYAFLFEVGAKDFHPQNEADACAIISENIPPILLGIEIAGDRQERGFTIDHSPISERDYASAGFEISVNISAERGVDESNLDLVFRVNGGDWMEAPIAGAAWIDSYSGTIPAQPLGSTVEYYIVAQDLGGIELMSPRYAPYEIYAFEVVDRISPVARTGSDVLASVGMTVYLDGSSSSDNFGISSYTWTFTYDGTEEILHGALAYFVFWVADVYQITLTVTDYSGNQATTVVFVDVVEAYVPEFGSAMLSSASFLAFVLSLMCLRRRRCGARES